MKTFRLFRICSSGILAASSAATLRASISLTGGTFTETFTTLPPATSWATTAANFGSGGANISNDATADGLVGTPAASSTSATPVTAALLSTQLPAAAISGTVATANAARYHSAGYASTAPTGTDGTLLMATLTNNTGGAVVSLGVSYVLGIQNGDVDTPEAEFAGHRIYWSLTGLQNSWNPIGDFGIRGTIGGVASQSQSFSLTVPVANWAAGANAYILWLDDNALTGADGLYLIDNVAFTPTPEPTAGLLALAGAGVCGLVRRRR